ncbi:unnamed protein product [marine sediment metagenome]|uniref:Uncharacterized protein n=1 Tax=marine sediment metagenome TaxID=412755 RepID=X0TWR1_9ZZZZ
MTNQYTRHTKEVGDYEYYNPYTLTTLYVEQVFGAKISTINLTNDSTTDTAQYSFDGATLHGEVGPGESVKVNVDQKSSIYVKGTAGGDVLRIWSYVDVSAGSVTVAFQPLGVVNKSYEATLTVGVSPLDIDFNSDAGRNSKEGWITCDGTNVEMTVEFSRDGITFGDPWTIRSGENTDFANFDIDTLRLTHTGDDVPYRVVLI